MRLTLDLTQAELDALVEDVTADTTLAESAGGNPDSEALLRKVEAAIRAAARRGGFRR